MAIPYNETGFSSIQPRDLLCDSLLEVSKPVIEQECGKRFQLFSCVQYMVKRQYGTNYKIKVQTEKDFMHLHLYTSPSGQAQVNMIEQGLSEEDDLALPFSLRRLNAPPGRTRGKEETND